MNTDSVPLSEWLVVEECARSLGLVIVPRGAEFEVVISDGVYVYFQTLAALCIWLGERKAGKK